MDWSVRSFSPDEEEIFIENIWIKGSHKKHIDYIYFEKLFNGCVCSVLEKELKKETYNWISQVSNSHVVVKC